MGRWTLTAKGSIEINTGAYCDWKMDVDGKWII
jgi:hypothetical protein